MGGGRVSATSTQLLMQVRRGRRRGAEAGSSGRGLWQVLRSLNSTSKTKRLNPATPPFCAGPQPQTRLGGLLTEA